MFTKIIIKMIKSFAVAFNGLFQLIRTERNFQIHIVALVLVCVAGFHFQITKFEWVVILLCSGIVLSIEAINTAIENLCDLYSAEINSKIKMIKDISAAGVLVTSIISAVVGILVFWKYLMES